MTALILAGVLLLGALACAAFAVLFACVGAWREALVLLPVAIVCASAASWWAAKGVC